MFEQIVSCAKSCIGKGKVAAREYAPEIALVGGIALVIFGGVLACKQTLRLDEVVSKGEARMEEIDAAVEDEVELTDGDTYTEDIAKDDRRTVTFHTAANVAKLYILPAGVAVLGFALIIGGHKMLRDRNAALLGAYATLATAYEAYRSRVRDEIGEEMEQDIYLGMKRESVEVKKTNPETGLEETVLVDIPKKSDCPLGNPWARVFNSTHSTKYDKNDNADQSYNVMYLKTVQTEAQMRLNAYGVLSANEVYDMLGFDRVPEGQIYGWVKGDIIDLGIFSSWEKKAFEDLWENDLQRTIIVSPNVGKEPITSYIKRGMPNGLEMDDPVAISLWAKENK